jgi:hypothetical protein
LRRSSYLSAGACLTTRTVYGQLLDRCPDES